MTQGLVRSETPIEYFKDLVEAALANQRLDAHELTAYYVVNLLAGFTHVDRPGGGIDDDEPLAFRLARAIDAGGVRQRLALRQIGDVSLFIAGFFSESLNRKLVDLDYYVALGVYAYGSLGRQERESFSTVFSELARKFVSFVDVLSEVSERTGVASNTDLLRLYEKWLRTGSVRNGKLLAERGIVPNSSIGNGFLQ